MNAIAFEMRRANSKLTLALVAVLVISLPILSDGVEEGNIPPGNTLSRPVAINELTADYSQPVITLDEVVNPTSSMAGDYPVHTYGTYSGRFFWMDNHRLIKSVLDEDKQIGAIESWDVDSGDTHRYGWGKIMCYADGMIDKIVYQIDSSKKISSIIQRGPLGQEKDFIFDKSVGVYDNRFECGEMPSEFTTRYLREHPDEIVVALRKGHGFLVVGKTEPVGLMRRTVLPNDRIIFHAVGKEPLDIPMNVKYEGKLSDYYPFVHAYAFQNGATGIQDRDAYVNRPDNPVGSITTAYILSTEGDVRKVKVPDIFLNGIGVSGPFLTRRGLLWANGRFRSSGQGIYLSRGEQVKKISSDDGFQEGVVSPNGCRFAYQIRQHNILGNAVITLKVIDLCKGEE